VAHHCGVADPLLDALTAHVPEDDAEAVDLARTLAVVESASDPWSRHLPLHLTASALVVDPRTQQVLLRWHAKQELWLQVGGHGDPGERDPWLIALREAEEETALPDLTPLPTGPSAPAPPVLGTDPDHFGGGIRTENGSRGVLFQVTIVPVKAAKGEPAHEHADLRFLLQTSRPEDAPEEREGVALRWFGVDDALAVADEGLARLLRRVPGLD
jgi:8-oxo-dGTP pyrophosphatase MutT (NUDIX family)